MIRRDYILKMIEEFVQALARISSLKKELRWVEASSDLTAQFDLLCGLTPEQAVQLSETELLATIVNRGPLQAVPEKLLILTSLLKETGDASAGQDRPDAAQLFYRRALRLLIAQPTEESVLPAYVPRIEALLACFQPGTLQMEDLALLMRYYETLQNYSRAEDVLYQMIELQSENPHLLQFGQAFYRRLASLGDEQLFQGGLTREEVKAGPGELERATRV